MGASLLFMLFLVMTADGFLLFLLPITVYMLTGSIEYTGLSYFLWWLPRLILIPLIGRHIDRLGIRPLSIFSDLVRASACLLIALCQFNSDLAIAVTFGITGSIISIGNSQIIVSYEKIVLVLGSDRERLSNLISRMDFLGMVLGPFIGMMLLFTGYRLLMLFPCILYFANALFFARDKINLREKDRRGKDVSGLAGKRDAPRPVIRVGYKTLLQSAVVFSILLAIGNNMFDGIIESTGMALIEREMRLPVKYYAIIDIAAGICGVAGTYFYSFTMNRLTRTSLLGASVAVITLCSSLIVTVPSSFFIFILCYALTISAKVFTGNLCRLIRLETLPAECFGTASSVIVLLNQSILPVVGLMMWFSDGSVQTTRLCLTLAVSISLLAGLALFWSLRRNQVASEY